jgi:hypothetical protein
MPSQTIISSALDPLKIGNKRPFVEDEVLVKKSLKPSVSFVDLIHEALDASESGLLSLSEIHDFITSKYSSDHFPVVILYALIQAFILEKQH